MILFKEEKGKYNFIDENDAFVGFDAYQCCCENFGWEFCYEVDESNNSDDVEKLKNYNFDTTIDPIHSDEEYGSDVYFTLRNEGGEVAYLRLYNYHNGYYGHGWGTSWGCEGYL